VAGAYHLGQWFDVDDTVEALIKAADILDRASRAEDARELDDARREALAALEEITFVREEYCEKCDYTHRGFCHRCDDCGEYVLPGDKLCAECEAERAATAAEGSD